MYVDYRSTLLLFMGESYKWDAGFSIYTTVQQLLRLLLCNLHRTNSSGLIPVSPFKMYLYRKVCVQIQQPDCAMGHNIKGRMTFLRADVVIVSHLMKTLFGAL